MLESKPDNVRPDWRLYNCFPALQAFVDSFDLETLDSHQHAHVPFPVLLVKFVTEWIETHGKRPSSYADKQKFKKL